MNDIDETGIDSKQNEMARPTPGMLIGNLGKPIILSNVNICGVAAETPLPGSSEVSVWTRASMTSAEALFHRIASNLVSAIEHCVQQAGERTSLNRAHTIILIMRPDNSAELWVDSAAVQMETRLKRGVLAGSIIFEKDIADVSGMWFPNIDVASEDRIIVLFREGFRFGLFFDFNPDGRFDIVSAKRELGTLHRQMRYADLYAVLANGKTFGHMVSAGWFPFIEIMNDDFKALSIACEAGYSLEAAEAEIVKKFTHERLDQMFDRWMTKVHFKGKEIILQSGLNAYKRDDWVACLKIILTEIEGIIAEAYYESTGLRTRKMSKLLDFTVDVAAKLAGGKDTLFFPSEFAHYLKNYTYAEFDAASDQQSGSRHAIGHGRASAEQYTQARALQSLLTLDQFAFYT